MTPILLIELEAIFESKELEGFTHKLEGFTQSNLLLDIETIRRKESSPFLIHSLKTEIQINILLRIIDVSGTFIWEARVIVVVDSKSIVEILHYCVMLNIHYCGSVLVVTL